MGTRAWYKKGINARREGALERLRASKFTPKNNRFHIIDSKLF